MSLKEKAIKKLYEEYIGELEGFKKSNEMLKKVFVTEENRLKLLYGVSTYHEMLIDKMDDMSTGFEIVVTLDNEKIAKDITKHLDGSEALDVLETEIERLGGEVEFWQQEKKKMDSLTDNLRIDKEKYDEALFKLEEMMIDNENLVEANKEYRSYIQTVKEERDFKLNEKSKENDKLQLEKKDLESCISMLRVADTLSKSDEVARVGSREIFKNNLKVLKGDLGVSFNEIADMIDAKESNVRCWASRGSIPNVNDLLSISLLYTQVIGGERMEMLTKRCIR